MFQILFGIRGFGGPIAIEILVMSFLLGWETIITADPAILHSILLVIVLCILWKLRNVKEPCGLIGVIALFFLSI